MLGVIVSYVIAACLGEVDFTPLGQAAWVGFPIEKDRTILAVFEDGNTSLMLSTILAFCPKFACLVQLMPAATIGGVTHWFIWIAVDVVTCVLYFYKGIPFKASLYALYVVIAIAGYFKWRRMMHMR